MSQSNTSVIISDQSGAIEMETADAVNIDREYAKQEMNQIRKARSKLTANVNKVQDVGGSQVYENTKKFIEKFGCY